MRNQYILTLLVALILCASAAVAEPDTFGLGTGRDGALRVTKPRTVINRYARVTGPLATGDNVLAVSSTEGFAAGDLVMVLQTTGILRESSQGTPGSIDLSHESVGRWELARLGSTGKEELRLIRPLVRSYTAGASQVIRVPEYNDVAVVPGASIVAEPWNGGMGGVLAFLASGTLHNEGEISATGAGFRGALSIRGELDFMGCASLPPFLRPRAAAGEGFTSTSHGGQGGTCPMAGGGGGGNGTPGESGETSAEAPVEVGSSGGQGGARLSGSLGRRLILGGGGGLGSAEGGSDWLSAGAGGGALFVRARYLTGNGVMTADGEPGQTGTLGGGSGGGAGGSIYLWIEGFAECDGISAGGGLGGRVASGLEMRAGAGGTGGAGRVLYQAVSMSRCPVLAGVVNELVADQPGAPTISSPVADSYLNTKRPIIRGETEANTTVTVTISGGQTVTGPATVTNGTWTFTPTTDLRDDAYTVTAVARKNNSQSEISVAVAFTIDTSIPDIAITSGPQQPMDPSRTPSFQFSSNEAPNVGYECKLDSQTVFRACNNPYTTPLLSDGSHVLTVLAKDRAGNVSSSPVIYAWSIDATAPTIDLPGKPSNPTSQRTATFIFQANDGQGSGLAKTQCSLDRQAFEDCTSPKEYGGLSEVEHFFGVRAVDRLNNASEVEYRWVVDATAPETRLEEPLPDNPSNVNSATFHFNSTETSTFECSLDSPTAWETCSSPKTYTGLTEGSHTFGVRATDAALNLDATPASHPWRVDTKEPDTILADPLPANPTNATTATFNFSTTESGSTFECSLGPPTVWSPCTSPKTYEALTHRDYTFQVRAKDSAGNVDFDPADHSWTVDLLAPPPPLVETPAEASYTNVSSLKVEGSAEELSQISISLDGTVVGRTTVGGDGRWTLFIDISPLAEGPHVLRAVATDKADNPSAPSSDRTFNLDRVRPDIRIVNFPPPVSKVRTATFEFEASSDLKHYECDRSDDSHGFVTCPSPFVIQDLRDGTYVLTVRAVDKAGNESSPADRSWTVDNSPPQVTLLTPENGGRVNVRKPIFTGTAEPHATVRVFIKNPEGQESFAGVAPAQANGSWNFESIVIVSSGTHSARAVATDLAGNAGETPSISFVVDTEPPETAIVSGPPNPHNSRLVSFVVKSPENATEFLCTLDDVGPFDCKASDCSPSSTDIQSCFILNLSTAGTKRIDGDHTLLVSAKDAAKNIDPTPELYTWTVVIRPPQPPRIDVPAEGEVVFELVPTIGGTTVSKGKVACYLGDTDTKLGLAEANEAGEWSFRPSQEMEEGSYAVRCEVTDSAGNPSEKMSQVSFSVVPPKQQAKAIGGGLGCSSSGGSLGLALLGLLAGAVWNFRRRR